ncbi:Na+/H+ antiporter NhaA [Poseidonibacter ostreae]|jgi:Na+:H+ antiporter, NhaA family|uniref:Na(+)/H(+) antiporter NhaA n=1 Tax=Poseidonibacter ostreae TaxID=2654171 RepID=A0A6L4WQ65_9BACT|nr:Na+/H+ antiporter NhaA [Poseidonibacter ostreae]KAB7886362.1 Na+/H+ antiporter NhaA [Poseidonibacter ostreae]KAB7887477.1 Na+/H+ antiporter NhaA [Poseidonibacter ostreae]KAB7891857.1 Na+/H+ antiporter NhaA [Poseidonibacter ostreae]MAC82830.1 Na+/H+ antiporter NhaA [Arcobacter sp.]|tara:strand:+ start:1921 stop:3111 length:1191 start_codon:yes stop_codon:yes gene_type:complete
MKVLVRKFLQKESTSGIILMAVTVLALIFSNTFLSEFYTNFLHTNIEFKIGSILEISKPLILWVNDGLMAIFFLLIGLEIKRELLLGHLSTFSKIALPAIAAVGGMLIPALIYVFFNYNDEFALRGWAIPTATDIAFALGIVSLLGKRVPVSLKIFLMALAIFDDLGAILIIAFFYTSSLSLSSLFFALICIIILITMNKMQITLVSAYALVGLVLWVFVLKSGVHATLAGIILAFTIPLNAINERRKRVSPVKSLQHYIHFWVAFYILPIFAFVNAGIDLRTLEMSQVFNPVSLGIILGLFVGKQVGVMLFVYLAVKFNFAKLPRCTTWAQIYGISVLTGIGFTMSLFVDSLAFEDSSQFFYTDKLAILIGSILSGLVGYLVLLKSKGKKHCSIS